MTTTFGKPGDDLRADCLTITLTQAEHAAALAQARADGMRAAYLAGFNASGEGWNGEYPFQDKGRSPEADADWIAARDRILAALSPASPAPVVGADLDAEPESGDEAEIFVKVTWRACVHGGGWWVGNDVDGREVLLPATALRATQPGPASVTLPAEVLRGVVGDHDAFEKADWFWRTMDPDDCGDSPAEALSRAMVGRFCVCEVASSYFGPTRYGFITPVADPESDDEEFVHFATQAEAVEAARAAISNVPRDAGETGQ